MPNRKSDLNIKVHNWLDGLDHQGLTKRTGIWKEDDDIDLLTALPGFSFDKSQMLEGLELAALREVILLGGGEISLSAVLNGVKLVFERSYDIRKEYVEDNHFIWLAIWEKDRFWSGKTTLATSETLKRAIDFYVAGFKNSQKLSEGGGITLPIDALQNPLIGSVLISIAKWLRLVEGTKYCFTINLEDCPNRDQKIDNKPSCKRRLSSPKVEE